MANSIKLRKVNVLKQTSYTYESVTGEIITIYPDENAGVTIDLIRELHRADNREVEQNLRQVRKPMTEAERRDITAWRADDSDDHPPRTKADFPEKYNRWNIFFDQFWLDDGGNALDCDPAMARAWANTQHEVPPEVERLREFIKTLPNRQQQYFYLVYIEGKTQREAAEIMGVNTKRASKLDAQVRANIRKHFTYD